jgi:CheY-like chemotaxis protein
LIEQFVVSQVDDVALTFLSHCKEPPVCEGPRCLRVLVVDDEQLVADTVTEILCENGFEAVGVYSGTDALEAAAKQCPDVLLTDVLMPRMSGVELAIRFREAYPRTRILLFSGQASTADIIRQAQVRGHDFDLLPKPIHPENLIAKLRCP